MDLVEFLTSKEIIVVYVVAAVACLLCFIIYLVERNNDKARKRHNTKELNKLVDQIKEETKEEVYEDTSINLEPQLITNEVIQEDFETTVLEPVVEVKDADIEYASIEPDIEAAKNELHKITEELKLQEEQTKEVLENAKLTSFEEEQESTAIISLEELVKRSKEMYEANELTQYADEGNEPISITEIEKRVGKEVSNITDTFVIENVVPIEELEEVEEPVIIESKKVVLDDFNTIKIEKEPEVKRFKNSPFISPIYGIENNGMSPSELELENTADYDKLDQEIKKTNEFLMTLRELQKKLD